MAEPRDRVAPWWGVGDFWELHLGYARARRRSAGVFR
jgi:hypothetical protein